MQTIPGYTRLYTGKVSQPDVESITGLPPVIALAQNNRNQNPRSTVGTVSEVYDLLRLLYARCGTHPDPAFELDRSLFSFNTDKGACSHCRGLGEEELIDLNKLVADPSLTLREGALAPTLPTGYIMYSQVTVDVLNDVCQAHGFDVDRPWKDLTPEQQHVVLYGSDRLKVPFGKHSLESRMKWSGITAKPRELGYYGGMIPVMENIMKRDRNKNILKYVSSATCSVCEGTRLNAEALRVNWQGHHIAQLHDFTVSDLKEWLANLSLNAIEVPIVASLLSHLEQMEALQLGYLQLSRPAATLSGGEMQRLRLCLQVNAEMQGVLYVFDEPTIGMHPSEVHRLIEVLRKLVNQGNTVVVVEHDDAVFQAADWVVDVGPGAGENGGEVLFNGPVNDFLKLPNAKGVDHGQHEALAIDVSKGDWMTVSNASIHNLQHVEVKFPLKAMTTVVGPSGAGKTSLVQHTLFPLLTKGKTAASIAGGDSIQKVIHIDQQPIGRTPRSNPATYTKLMDEIRDCFAKEPLAKERGFKKGRFSFNNKGGRCETCEGAGVIGVGMHFLGNVNLPCPTCGGKRFNAATLEVKWKGLSIAEVLELSVSEAIPLFETEKVASRILATLAEVGLGYLKLGQPSTTLSGGEAQRVKLAAELQRPATAHTLYLLDEPTTGLHHADVLVLLKALRSLVHRGHTVVVVEHHLEVVQQSDYVLELGPGSGKRGGQIVAVGTPQQLAAEPTLTGHALNGEYVGKQFKQELLPPSQIALKGVRTHNLKGIDISIPLGKITAITGVSGSGKSSLAFDTLFALAQNRFLEATGSYARRMLTQSARTSVEQATGLTPVVALEQRALQQHPRSTVGTVAEVYELYRLLFSRIGKHPEGKQFAAGDFSFNRESGACMTCKGLGVELVTDASKLITHPELPIVDGAMQGTKTGKFYGDPHGQHMAILRAVAEELDLDLDVPYQDLNDVARSVVLEGAGERVFETEWHFKNKTRQGKQQLAKPWYGLLYYVREEYQRKHEQKGGDALRQLLKAVECSSCHGHRLNPEVLRVKVGEYHIGALAALTPVKALRWFETASNFMAEQELAITRELRANIIRGLEAMVKLGLGHLALSRSVESLSAGEAQRLRLARQISATLCDTTFILDEPAAGLHPKDCQNLLVVLQTLIDQGNTVVLVSHHPLMIEAADNVIALGPGAGEGGGELTSPIRTAYPSLQLNKVLRPSKFLLSFKGLEVNNLKNIDLSFGSSRFVVLSGVSGAGKSTVLFEVIQPSLQQGKAVGCTAVSIPQSINVVACGQASFAGSSSSIPLTYLGVFDDARKWFAHQKASKEAGLKASHFSFNHKLGRCETCAGQGELRVSMDFMSDVWVTCNTCSGKRYRSEVLAVEVNGKNIGDVLEMSAEAAKSYFEGVKKVSNALHWLSLAGLGHLQLGQSTRTLSGGEAQRLRLVKALLELDDRPTVILLDEPAKGLHPSDVLALTQLIKALCERGHTVVAADHQPHFMLSADHIIDLGPEGGEQGGSIVEQGTPQELLENGKGATALALQQLVKQ